MRESIFCNHYRAMAHHKTCEADVEYDSFKGLSFDKRPCFARLVKKAGEYVAPCGCDKAQFPTAEEIAAEDAEFQKIFERSMTARQAIVAHLGGPWKRGMPGSSGQIQCPICTTGNLQFSRAGYNGHIHAACTTEGCVRWME